MLKQTALNVLPGDVTGMQNASLRVPTLFTEIVSVRPIIVLSKGHPKTFKIGNAVRSFRDNAFHHPRITEPITSPERVSHMLLEAVILLHHTSDTALRIARVGFARLFLGQDENLPMLRQLQCSRQSGDTAPHH